MTWCAYESQASLQEKRINQKEESGIKWTMAKLLTEPVYTSIPQPHVPQY